MHILVIMRGFIQKFNEIQQTNPYWSSWTCFCEVLREIKLKDEKKIRRYFNKLVDKEDYEGVKKSELIKYLREELGS